MKDDHEETTGGSTKDNTGATKGKCFLGEIGQPRIQRLSVPPSKHFLQIKKAMR